MTRTNQGPEARAADILAAIDAHFGGRGVHETTFSRDEVTPGTAEDEDPPLDAAGVEKARRDTVAYLGEGEPEPAERPDAEKQLADDLAAYLGFDTPDRR